MTITMPWKNFTASIDSKCRECAKGIRRNIDSVWGTKDEKGKWYVVCETCYHANHEGEEPDVGPVDTSAEDLSRIIRDKGTAIDESGMDFDIDAVMSGFPAGHESAFSAVTKGQDEAAQPISFPVMDMPTPTSKPAGPPPYSIEWFKENATWRM